MAALYSLEESLERAAISVLSGITAFSSCRIVSADESDEETFPMITVKAERTEELVPGCQTWTARLTVSLNNAADETPDAEIEDRRYPEDQDDDTGAAGLKSLWKTLSATVSASSFKTSLNATDLTYVWGLEADPASYSTAGRTFVRSLVVRLWVNEVEPAS